MSYVAVSYCTMVCVLTIILCIFWPTGETKIKEHRPVSRTVGLPKCDKCHKVFWKKNLAYLEDTNEHLCKDCFGLVKIYLDKEE